MSTIDERIAKKEAELKQLKADRRKAEAKAKREAKAKAKRERDKRLIEWAETYQLQHNGEPVTVMEVFYRLNPDIERV